MAILQTSSLFCKTRLATETSHHFNLTGYVNILMSTDSYFELSNGNAAILRGINFRIPQNGKTGNGWISKYGTHKTRGIKQTRLSCPCIYNCEVFSFISVTETLKHKEYERALWFSHKAGSEKEVPSSVHFHPQRVTTRTNY
ncbi:MAG: hypothetical protein GXO47_06565 [Chlorobi bacterium]|nr:hypothetical protein [Chlorobiota bacterium]